jgi:drug/metabolite transporter (DMT)-like permease
LVHLALMLVQIAFASGAIAGRLAFSGKGHLDPTALAFVRAAVGALAFQLASRALGLEYERPAARDHRRLFGLSILGVVINQAFFLHGLKRGTAQSAGLLAAAIPVFTAAIGVAIGREKPRLRTLVGIAVATGGVLVLTGIREVTLSNLLFTINSLAYASYLVAIGPDVRRFGALRTIAWIFTWGAVLLVPFGVPALVRDLPQWTTRDVEIVAWFVLVPTIFAYLANAWALGRAKPSIVATYVYMQPLLVLIVAGRMLGKTMSSRLVVAGAAILLGVTIVVFRRQKADGPREEPKGDRRPTTDDRAKRAQASK